MPALKAPERPCRACGGTIPAQPSGPGRPRDYCSRKCRTDYHHRQEQAAIARERAAEVERRRFEYERRVYGKREADRLARERARNRSERSA